MLMVWWKCYKEKKWALNYIFKKLSETQSEKYDLQCYSQEILVV